MPTSTDLVTDLPADFEVFGQAVDTSLADLKGGTTNQVLAKNSNTDMDFKWVADASGIPASSFTAKGDLLVGTGSGTYTAQTVGANGTVLTANSAQADGVEWATVPSGGMTLIASGTLSGTSVLISSIPQTYKDLVIYVRNGFNSGGTNDFTMQLNSGGTNQGIEFRCLNSVYQVQTVTGSVIMQNVGTSTTNAHAYIHIPDYTATDAQIATVQSSHTTSSNNYGFYVFCAYPTIVTGITDFRLGASSTFGGGTYEMYGVK
jgi:hypothetical protein